MHWVVYCWRPAFWRFAESSLRTARVLVVCMNIKSSIKTCNEALFFRIVSLIFLYLQIQAGGEAESEQEIATDNFWRAAMARVVPIA